MTDKADLMHRCRLARDFLFSVKNEGSSREFLVTGPGMEEHEAMLVWNLVSKRLETNHYICSDEFIEDVQPLKIMLLQCKEKARPTKRRAKYIDLIFRRLYDITSPPASLVHDSCHQAYSCNPYEDIVNALTAENAVEIIESIHNSGKSYALKLNDEISKQGRKLITNGTRDSNVHSDTSHASMLSSEKAGEDEFSPHGCYYGVSTRKGTSHKNKESNKYFAFITVEGGRGRAATCTTVMLQPQGFSDVVEAARAHDLACIRTRGPEECDHSPLQQHQGGQQTRDLLVKENTDGDNSRLLNFPIAQYAEEAMRAFTRWDAVLLKGLATTKQWPGLQPCDFSFLLFAAPSVSPIAVEAGVTVGQIVGGTTEEEGGRCAQAIPNQSQRAQSMVSLNVSGSGDRKSSSSSSSGSSSNEFDSDSQQPGGSNHIMLPEKDIAPTATTTTTPKEIPTEADAISTGKRDDCLQRKRSRSSDKLQESDFSEPNLKDQKLSNPLVGGPEAINHVIPSPVASPMSHTCSTSEELLKAWSKL